MYTIIVKYAVIINTDNIRENEVEFTSDGSNIDEYKWIEEFYYKISHNINTLTNLKWFYILNTDTHYDLDLKNKDEAYYKLYEMALLKIKMSRLENEAVNAYTQYIKTKAEYYNAKDNKK